MNYEQIVKNINKLSLNADPDLLEVQAKLHECLSRAANAGWSRDDLETYIFSEEDPLDKEGIENIIERDGDLWQDIRDIQNDIIDEFCIKED